MDLYKGITPCTLLLLIAVSGAAGTVVNGILGRSVEFSVSVPPETNTIAWTFKGSIIAQLYPGSDPFCIDSYKPRCELYRNGSLRLDNAQYDDTGDYTMTALNNGATTDTKTFQLKIYNSLTTPDLKLNSTSLNASALVGGTHVTIHCDAGAQDVTTYTFYQNQVNVCSKPNVTCRGPFLDFQPINANDSGTYTCTIQNPVSTSTSNPLDLTVIVPVSGVTLAINTSDSLIWPGKESVSLHCSAHGTNVRFSWNLEGAPLSPSPQYHITDNDATLVISPVSANESGSFTCTASNSISNGTSNEIKLNLASPVSAVTLTSNASGLLWEGKDSVTLFCSAQGSAVDFSWTLNGQLLSNTTRYHITQHDSSPNSNLTISPVSRMDRGPIYCAASNLENTLNSTALDLDVAWPPEGNIVCAANTSNQNVELICSWPGGQPAANVSMEFNNVIETKPNHVTRTLDPNMNILGSNMTCSGDQLGTTSNCTVIFEAPVSPGHKNDTVTDVTEGGKAVMTVNLLPGSQVRATSLINRVLPAHFSWVHLKPDRTPIQNGGKFNITSTDYSSSLQISGVTKEDNGTYECTARNGIGSTTFAFNIAVTTTPPSSGLDGGQIAGIVIGALAGVAIIGVIIFFIFKKN